VETLKQTFETCAVCTKGIEKGQIISCVQWGHKWEYFGKAAGSYLYDVMLWAALAERRVMAFINADTGKYEPEKSWFYDPALKGYRLRLPEGGEMIELVGYKGTPPSAALRGLVAGYGYFYREPVP